MNDITGRTTTNHATNHATTATARGPLPRLLTLGAGALLLASTAACSAPGGAGEWPDTAPTALDASGPGLSRVVLLGDSVAAGQATPLHAAFGSAGVEFSSMASTGGGNVVGPNSEEIAAEVADRIRSARPSTVIYQITTYDWGTVDEQRDAYGQLLDTVTAAGGKLVLVTMPPIRGDEFYEPHLDELAHATEAAAEVADASDDAILLDASEVWGDEFRRERDGNVDRSSDGTHTCPQGAARWTNWLLGELADTYPDFTPPAPEDWADTGWSDDAEFVGC
ncbi:SGNH/GDSL hydrolase family protein [Myceligenerans pegani]|nr:SGNH/GDSL hydrolase family protein [Myceligenerans sp. TRM 65318]